MTTKLFVMAKDGSSHTYPMGFSPRRKGQWLVIEDESHIEQAAFFRPRYYTWRDL